MSKAPSQNGNPADLFFKLSRGVPGRAARDMSPPEMSFADPAAVMASPDLAYGAGKIFLGVVGGDVHSGTARWGGTERYITGGAAIGVLDDRHMLTVAGTRAGKGRSAIVPNMLRYPGSVLAIDPKGELATVTAQARAKMDGHRVYVLDPFGETMPPEGQADALALYRCGFNPMEAVRATNLVEDASLIADALVVSDRSNDPHWTESARTLIEGVIMLVATHPVFKGKRDLTTVYRLIGKGLDVPAPEGEKKRDGMELLKQAMLTAPQEAIQLAGADFFDRPDRERGSVLSTARRQLRPMAFDEIAASLSAGGLDLADLKRESVTIYLCIPARHLGTCGRWLRLFVNIALQAMERVKAAPKVPVLFLLDEFAALGPMRQIEDAAGQIAGYGVKLWPILQDLGQLKALYKDRWETFMGNAGVLQFFGNSDLTTLEWISKRLGKTAVEVLGQSTVAPGSRNSGATGESYSVQLFSLLEPEAVALIFGRADPALRQLIIRPGLQPMILQRAYYDKHDAFAGLVS
jgi:type IV secretion system protein VirD4